VSHAYGGEYNAMDDETGRAIALTNDLSPSARLRKLFRLGKPTLRTPFPPGEQMTALKAVFSWKNAQLLDLQRPE